MAGFDPKGDYVIADEAGLDPIIVFKLDLTHSRLQHPIAARLVPDGHTAAFARTIFAFLTLTYRHSLRIPCYGFEASLLLPPQFPVI